MPNLVSLAHSNLQVLGKSQTGVFPISGLLVNPLKTKRHNSRTSDYIDMKLGPVIQTEKKNRATLQKKNDDVTSLSFSDLWPIRSNPKAGFWTHGQ